MIRFLVAGLVLLPVVNLVRADDADYRAVRAIEKLGRKVKRDANVPGNPVVGVGLTKTAVEDENFTVSLASPR